MKKEQPKRFPYGLQNYWSQPQQLYYLRYGKLEAGFKVKPIRTLHEISQFLGMSSESVRQRIKQYHAGMVRSQDKRRKSKLSAAQIDFLCSESTLKSWASFSLQQRTILFHRMYPTTKISRTTLSKIYKANHISKMAVYYNEKAKRQEPAEMLCSLTDVLQSVHQSEEESRKIIFVDETVFTKCTQISEAWSKKGEPISVRSCRSMFPTQVVVAGISKSKGLEGHLLKAQSIKSDDFVQFLNKLVTANRKTKLAVFLDNATFHRSKAVREFAAQKDIRLIYNIPYAPQLNCIEHYWSIVKHHYKKLLLSTLIAQDIPNIEQLVRESLGYIRDQTVKKIATRGIELLNLA